MGRTTGYFRPGQAGGSADPYPSLGQRKKSFLNRAGSARARMMEEQLKMAQLQRLAMLEQFKNSRTRPYAPANVISSNRGTQAASDQERMKRAIMMADAIKGSAMGFANANPNSRQNLIRMIYAIGPEAAQQGLMQTGRLFASQSGSPVQGPAEKMEALNRGRPFPYGGGGSGEVARATPGGSRGTPVPGSELFQGGYNSAPFTEEYQGRGMTPYTQFESSAPGPDIGSFDLGSLNMGPLGLAGSYRKPKGYEKGTLPGTVPKTDKVTVHKGEVVVPKQQVDSGLMRYLVADAMRKKVPLGRKANGGYAPGTLGETSGGLLTWQQLVQKAQEARKARDYEQFIQDLDGYRAEQAKTRALVPQRGPTTFEMKPGMMSPGKLGPDYPTTPGVSMSGGPRQRGAPEIEKAYRDWVKSATPAEQKLLPPGEIQKMQKLLKAGPDQGAQAAVDIMGGGTPLAKGPIGSSLGRIPTRPPPTVSQEAAEVLKKTSKGKILLAALAGSGVVIGAAPHLMSDKDVGGLDYPGYPFGASQVGFWKAISEGKSVPEAVGVYGKEVGRGLKKVLGGPLKAVAGPTGGAAQFMQGLTGGGWGEYFDQGIPEAADEAFARNMEGKAQPGDWPPPEVEPIEPEGELPGGPPERSERDKAYGEVRELSEQKKARHEADMARASMKNTMTLLLRQGHSMDPEVKKSLMDQVSFHKQIADGWEKEISRREKAVEDELKAVKTASADYEKRILLEEQRIQGRSDLEEQKASYRSTLADKKALQGNLKMAWTTAVKGNSRQRREAEGALMRYIANMARSEGYDLSDSELQEMTQSFFALGPAEIDAGIRELTGVQ